MNRFQFLKVEIVGRIEFAYVLDTEAGVVYRSVVREMGDKSATIKAGPANAGTEIDTVVTEKKESDPTGEIETADERKARLSAHKVPPAFLGDTRRMFLDPAKTDGKTDVTPMH